MENDLKNIFLEQDVEKIYTRIGIDAGEDADVLWYQAGMGECSEISTCSLHTSLAAHMQGNADSNGIMVGDNVKLHSSFRSDLFSIKGDRYIFTIPEENFNYTQWDLNWKSYLKNHPSLKMDENGKLYFAPAIVPAAIPVIPSQSRPQNIDYLRTQTAGYKPYSNE